MFFTITERLKGAQTVKEVFERIIKTDSDMAVTVKPKVRHAVSVSMVRCLTLVNFEGVVTATLKNRRSAPIKRQPSNSECQSHCVCRWATRAEPTTF